jgi:hypothetical protein
MSAGKDPADLKRRPSRNVGVEVVGKLSGTHFRLSYAPTKVVRDLSYVGDP